MAIKINKTFHKKFGQKVKEYRIAKDLTQDELSWKIGVESSSYINKVENANLNISLARIKKIADILEVNVKDLFDF